MAAEIQWVHFAAATELSLGKPERRAVSPDGQFIVTGHLPNMVRSRAADTDEILWERALVDPDLGPPCDGLWQVTPGDFAFSADGTLLAVATVSPVRAMILDAATGNVLGFGAFMGGRMGESMVIQWLGEEALFMFCYRRVGLIHRISLSEDRKTVTHTAEPRPSVTEH